ncbi:Structural maintenance of chromosomes protein 6 [Armadillidium nasatum]|uniref:Structural maintenance of chromosomes protein 6 n=1 Tax=Armadillidium nasatum TaxID=96803 RepID=A0A5N5TP77_9CRUS|nr:Structural maintenance of chromosomes protein 6 [Armadillidium nasatum]
MSFEVINIEGKRRKISRISVDEDEIQICEVPNTKKEIQCGIIKRIILKNVFCHEHLDIENFIPQLNLLQGANGSGKSSVVAGIIIGLGGTCKATERGKNISSIIKNGKNSASIVIHLSNDGYNPFQKEKYGSKIIIERKLTLSGSSSYKIKSEFGGIVSEKKEDLKKILDKFNIQVDNPALILSQERAKTFLGSTDPKQLFKFFMTSTQLKQWSDCITEINNDLESQKILNSRKK